MMGERLGPLLGVFQSLLRDEMLLSISRLTDRDSRAQRNLSVWCLQDSAKYATSPDFARRVIDKLSSIEKATFAIRKHRHKRLAHYDLDVSLKASVLPKVTFTEIKEQIERIESLLNLIFREFSDTTMFFDTLTASDITGRAEVTVRKAKTYDILEAEGVIPRLTWRKRT
jgi:hypothetical protein